MIELCACPCHDDPGPYATNRGCRRCGHNNDNYDEEKIVRDTFERSVPNPLVRKIIERSIREHADVWRKLADLKTP